MIIIKTKMVFMDYKTITQHNIYKYTPKKPGQKGFFNTLAFYIKIGMIILRSNRLATKGKYDGEAWILSSYDILKATMSTGVEIEFEGLDNVKLDEPVVYISNHMSTLETFILPCIIHPNNKVCFIMKKELVDMPFFGPVGAARHPIVVGRKNPREDLMEVFKQSKDRLESGRSIIVFPQKSRSDKLMVKGFNTIGVKIAKKYNVKIVPVALTTDFWQNGKLVKDFGKIDPAKKVRISFGKPFEPTGEGSNDNQTVLDFIESKFKEWNLENKIVK